MSDKEIVLKSELKIKKYEFTEEQLQIYNAGYDKGWQHGGSLILGLILFYGLLILLISSFYK